MKTFYFSLLLLCSIPELIATGRQAAQYSLVDAVQENDYEAAKRLIFASTQQEKNAALTKALAIEGGEYGKLVTLLLDYGAMWQDDAQREYPAIEKKRRTE